MRILALNWRDLEHPWAGGAEVALHEVARRWVACGHEVTVFAGAWPGARPEVTIDGIRFIRRGGRLTVYVAAALAYLGRLGSTTDAVLDVENAIPFFTPLYARRPGALMVHHVHREQVFVEAGFPLNWGAYLLETRLMPLVYRRGPVITGSASARDGLVALGFDPAVVHLIPYGLDHGRYRPGTELTPPRPVILYLGRLKRYKRLDLALRAMPAVLAACPGAELWIAGQGDAAEELARLVAGLDLGPHVRLLGYVDEGEKIRMLRSAAVFVNPSMNEGWGLSVLEANACGTPAVVFDVAGLRDAVVDGTSGFVVPDGDIPALAHRLGQILLDPALRERLRAGAIEWAARFDWDVSARAILDVLRGGPPAPRSTPR